MITLRLDAKLESSVVEAAQKLGLSKSELIRKSIAEFIEKLDKPSAWELGAPIFGQYGSQYESLSRDRKALLQEKLQEKQKQR
ncbi:MAG: CopG family transcriptional regulator [Gammaproteobacteria bacterium]|nr:CopG family transcriptional regulator [Gammaproteobacteria bacterium]MDQ7073712.1 CopG family transcriptional regulator [Gammaproteobacteria bacterium]